MQNQITAQVLGIRRGNVDGNNYASIYLLEESDPSKPDEIGKLPIKMSCAHDLLDKVVADKATLPGTFDLMVKLNMGAGGKASMVATDIRPAKTSAAPVQSPAGKS